MYSPRASSCTPAPRVPPHLPTDRHLPMRRALMLVALLAAAAAAVAAPVPKEAQAEEQFRKRYGTRHDEHKRAKFTLTGDRLHVALAAHVDEPPDPNKPPR